MHLSLGESGSGAAASNRESGGAVSRDPGEKRLRFIIRGFSETRDSIHLKFHLAPTASDA